MYVLVWYFWISHKISSKSSSAIHRMFLHSDSSSLPALTSHRSLDWFSSLAKILPIRIFFFFLISSRTTKAVVATSLKFVEYVIERHHLQNDENDHVSWYHLIKKKKKYHLKIDKKWTCQPISFNSENEKFHYKMIKTDNVLQALQSKSSLRPTNYLLEFSQIYRKWLKTSTRTILLQEAFETIWKY